MRHCGVQLWLGGHTDRQADHTQRETETPTTTIPSPLGHIGLVPAHLPRSHYLQNAHARSAITVLSVDAFLKINISQCSVATPLRCGGICNDLFIANFLQSITVKEFLKMFLIR